MAAMATRKTVLITGGAAASAPRPPACSRPEAGVWPSRGYPSSVPAVEGISAYRCDIRNEAEAAGLFRQVAADFGRIDALVNNAGITGLRCRIETTADLLRDITATNLIGPILCAREAIRHMAPLGGGSIVNLSSTATKRGSPDQGCITRPPRAPSTC